MTGFDPDDITRAATAVSIGELADRWFESECQRLGVDRRLAGTISPLDLIVLASSTGRKH